jgi:Protein of unknown function (DUF4238)
MDHHHVPQFLLRKWCGGHDDKLEVYQRINGRAVSKRSPEYTGYETDLYAIDALPPAERHWVETNVMTRAVDTSASLCLDRLLTNGVNSLDQSERSIWVRFIIAQWMRAPEKIADIRERGVAIVRQAIDLNQENTDA